MFKITEVIGNSSKVVGMFEFESEAYEFLNDRWEERFNELDEDEQSDPAEAELFYSYFDVEDDGRELISREDFTEMYDAMINETSGDITVAWISFTPSHILKELDTIAYDWGMADYYNSISDEYYCEDME